MTQEMRQEIVKLARELPDELLAEALVFLQTPTEVKLAIFTKILLSDAPYS